jgi:hypothetical protein
MKTRTPSTSLLVFAIALVAAGSLGACTKNTCGPGTVAKNGVCTADDASAKILGEGGDGPRGPKGQVTQADCDAWGAKFSTLTMQAFVRNIKKCGKKAAKEGDNEAKENARAAEKEAIAAFAKAIEAQTKELVKGCAAQIGKDYATSDAACFTKSEKISDWPACQFTTPFFADFSDLGATFDKTMDDKCQEGIDEAKSKPPADDD